MGHTMPVVLTEMDHPVVDLHVESGTNDAFEELVLAHARRRKAMQDAIQSAATALEQHALDVDAGHDQAANAHANLQDRMIELTRNRDELVKLLQSYKEKLDDAHRAEKQSERKGGQARREAIDAARKLVADAHLQAAAIRREGGQALIDGHQQPQ